MVQTISTASYDASTTGLDVGRFVFFDLGGVTETTGACSGYVIDHVNPLKRGGADDPSNMQWQTRGEARAKDRVE